MAGMPVAAIGAASDPRVDNGLAPGSYPTRVLQKLHDTSIPFEEYLYYAKITREEEERLYGPGSSFQATDGPVKAFWKSKVLRKPVTHREVPIPRSLSISADGEPLEEKDEKHSAGDNANGGRRGSVQISDEEWVQASRAARTATWSAVFYLITTDILGPFSTGYAFSQMGFGPGVALFTIFGVLSWYTAYQLWRMFLQLDSDRYPMKGYGDIAFRVYGPWFRHTVNVLQSFQFFLNVALIVISSGQSISQMSKGKLCFIVCVVVCAAAGCIIGQIRTLQRFGWLASSAVFMNLLIIFCTMGVIAHSTPNYTALFASYGSALFPNGINDPPPVTISAASPPGLNLVDNVNGLMNAVFSFGGATLFVELMAEMRRPMDFWKGMICAEVLIYVCYMVYGCYCYALQGQYVFNPSYQGVSPYGWQTFGNVLGLITGIIAAVLYGNIGIKVLYNNIGRDLFKAPLLESKKGKWLFFGIVPIYWISAFIVAVSVPQITSWIVFVGAACILQFTYTFPPFLMVGFKSQRDAILPEETFDPTTGSVHHVDSGMKRWIRGFKKELVWNIWDVIFTLGSATTAILGIYSAISIMNHAYHSGSNLVGWSCNSPTG